MTMTYQSLVGCSRRTAARNLEELLDKCVIVRKGAGRGAHYVLNRAINEPNAPFIGHIGHSFGKWLINGSIGSCNYRT